MPKYIVRVKHSDDRRGQVIIDTGSDTRGFMAIDEKVDELYQEDPDAFDWEPEDQTQMDSVEIIGVKPLEENEDAGQTD